jgi:hypothetical protein
MEKLAVTILTIVIATVIANLFVTPMVAKAVGR